jgi:hypothetical protein
LILSLVNGPFDTRPQRIECAWEEIVQALSTHQRRIPKEGPLFSPCEFDGRGKSADCVVQVWFGVLDFDSIGPAEFQAALAVADRFDAFAYSTHSHSDHQLKARLVVRWSRPVAKADYRAAWLGMASIFPGCDAQCKDPGRFYYTPSCLPDAVPAFWRSSGREPLDVDGLAQAGLAAGATSRAPVPATDALPRGAIKRTIKKWLRSSSAELRACAALLELGSEGTAMAGEGARDQTLFRLACALAGEFPTTDPRSFAAELSASLSQWGDSERPWGDLFAEKIARKQSELSTQRGAAADGLSARASENVALALGRAHPYTPEELTNFQDAHPFPLRRRWIAAHGNSVYALVEGSYRGPWVGLSAGPALVQALSPASSAGVQPYQVDGKGQVQTMPVSTMLETYGVALDRVEADMTASKAYLAPPVAAGARSLVLVEAPCPLRAIEPAYDPEVDTWLALLCGDAPGAPEGAKRKALLDWLATVTDLAHPSPGLYLHGAPGAGKSLLPSGLAKLWSSSPCPLSAAMGDFNDEILRCPLVFGDERIPDRNGVPRTEELRELITTSEFTVNRKHAQRFVARGSVRVVLSANAPNLVARNADLNSDDVRALGDRLISIKARVEAAEYLKTVNTEDWARAGDRIAAHALWLRDAARAGVRPVAQGTRLLVPSNSADLVASIQVSSGLRWQVLYWICSYLRAPDVHLRGAGGRPAVLVHGGIVFVAPARLPECWAHYLGLERPPTVERVLAAIKAVTLPAGPNAGETFRRLAPDALSNWSELSGEPVPALASAELAVRQSTATN